MILLVAFLSYVIPIVLFLLFCFKKAKIGLWVIFFYLLLSFAVDFFTGVSKFGHENARSITSIFTICEFAMLASFFYLSFSNQTFKKITLYIIPVVLIFFVVNFVNSNKKDFDSTSASIESITLIIFSIAYFFGEISKPQPYLIYSSPDFWIVLAILIYMSSTLFLFIIANNLSPQEKEKYWVINRVSNFITNVIFCIAFVRNKYYQADQSAEKPSYY